jgi:Mrp family chromosome partitioning ATPase/capsular polysaccharide biosynthesis protein
MHAPQPLARLSDGPGERLTGDHCNPRLHNEEVIIGVLRLMWFSRGMFVIVAVLAVALATLFLRFGPRAYSAESVIRFDFAAGSAASTPRFSLDATAMVDGEARIARSRVVAEHVVSRLRLFDDAAFAAPPGLLSQVLAFVDGRAQKAAQQSDPRTTAQSEAFDRAVGRVAGASSVDHDNKSYVIAIRARWSDPQVAARLANTLAQEYLRERHIQSLIAARARLSAELAQIALRLGDKFPTYLTVKAQLDEIGRTIDEASQPTTPIRSVALGDFTADIAIPAQASPAVVSPNPKSVYALALAGGLMLAAAFLWLRQRYDTRLTNEWAVANRLDVRCFGIVPSGTSWRASARAALHEAARSIAVTAGLEIKDPSCRVVVLTSSLPDEGKTLLATALASVLSEIGQRVLLIDATPQSHPHRLGRRNDTEPGSNEKTGDDALAVTNGGKPAPFHLVVLRDRQHSLVGGEGFSEYMTAARKRHDLIIIKAPPVLMLSDTIHLARYADLLILLVHWRKTPARTAAQALRRLHDAGTPASGAILTNVRLSRRADTVMHDQSYYLARYGKFYASISSRFQSQ